MFSLSVLSVYSGSRRSLHYNGRNRHKREEVPLFDLSCSLEKAKKLPFERTFRPHPLFSKSR